MSNPDTHRSIGHLIPSTLQLGQSIFSDRGNRAMSKSLEYLNVYMSFDEVVVDDNDGYDDDDDEDAVFNRLVSVAVVER